MRKYLIFLLLFSSCFCLYAKDRVIEDPSFELSNTGISHITKIELKKSETRVHIHQTFIPRWWVKFSKKTFIKDSKSGEKLYAKSIIGGEFDKEIYMGPSGDSSFVLIFPPLDHKVVKVDFGEDEETLIYGLWLDMKQKKSAQERQVPAAVRQWIDTELHRAKVKTLVDYSSPRFFSNDTARLIGYIKGYDPRLNFHTGMIYASNKITWEDSPVIVRIHEDGRFEADIPIVHPEYTRVRIKNQACGFYIEPGQTLSMILNWDDFLAGDRYRNAPYIFKDVQFDGTAAQINKELLGASHQQSKERSLQESFKTLSPEQFKAQQLALWKKSSTDLENLIQKYNYCSQTKVILRNELAMANASVMFDFIMDRESAARKETANPILKIKPDQSFYDFMQQLDLNDRSLLLTPSFSTFINRFEFSIPISNEKYLRQAKPAKTFQDYLFGDLKLTPTQEDLAYISFSNSFHEKLNTEITEIEKNRLVKTLNTVSGAFFNKYKRYFAEYQRLNPAPTPISVVEQELQTWQRIDSVIANYYRLKPNLIYDIMKVRSLKFTFDNRMKKDEALVFLDLFEKGLASTFLAQEARRMFDQSYPVAPLVAYDLPAGKASEIFRKIIDPHKGKMLFIDFWGIYCGPCISAIEWNSATRQKYKDSQDLKFLFITSDDESPQARYDEFVKKQGLENTYKLSGDDYLYLRQLFKFNGIPRYIVVNKKGQIMDDNFQMHNFEFKLKEMLAK